MASLADIEAVIHATRANVDGADPDERFVKSHQTDDIRPVAAKWKGDKSKGGSYKSEGGEQSASIPPDE